MHSMTGFGRGAVSRDGITVEVTASSLNRKQCEVVITLPRNFSELEADMKKVVLSCISRGRVQVQISITTTASSGQRIDRDRVRALELELSALSEVLGRSLELQTSDILALPGVFQMEEVSPEAVRPLLHTALEEAVGEMVRMRAREGADLREDIQRRLEVLSGVLTQMRVQAPLVLETYREKLFTKLSGLELPGGVELAREDERLLREIALFAEKSDISEEVTRFQSHVDKCYEYLREDRPMGRSLDFLCQELSRELNTVGAKANNAELAHLVVKGKTEVEKIREQVQNVE